ncbi:MAG: HdeD family acid-resistance protein [Candidatus Limnocylindrales bacterium]
MMGGRIAPSAGLLALRGIVLIVLGLLLFATPAITLATMLLVFGICAIIDGALMAIFAFAQRRDESTWWLGVVAGVLLVLLGLLALINPSLTLITFLYVIIAWALVSGIWAVVTVALHWRELAHHWGMLIGGIAGILFGLYALAYPGAGAVALVFVIALYAIVAGVFALVAAWQVHQDRQGLAA